MRTKPTAQTHNVNPCLVKCAFADLRQDLTVLTFERITYPIQQDTFLCIVIAGNLRFRNSDVLTEDERILY